MGKHRRVVITYWLRFSPVDSVVQHCWRQEVHCRLSLGKIYVLTFSGPVAMIKRSHNCRRQKPWRDIVGICAHVRRVLSGHPVI